VIVVDLFLDVVLLIIDITMMLFMVLRPYNPTTVFILAQQEYEQIFHRSMDPYDEYDLLNMNLSTRIQPTDEIYKSLKERYHYMKDRAQSGAKV
jgi:hypothetical protein